MACILAYHRIAEGQLDVHQLCVSPADFRVQMSYVKSEYDVVALRDLVGMVERGDIPPRAVAITFDDGYLDNYTTASPILTELGLPATFFVTSDRLNTPYEYWWDALVSVFLAPGPAIPPVLAITLCGGRRIEAKTVSEEERLTTHWLAYRALADEQAEERDESILRLIRWSGRLPTGNPEARRINMTELQTLCRRPGHE